MPLVFVHGVANRWGADYAEGAQTRNALFRQFLLRSHRRADNGPIQIVNPYWGDLGAKLRWDGVSLPADGVEQLGGADAALAQLHAIALPDRVAGQENQAVLRVARRSLTEAVDLLWTASALSTTTAQDGSELAALAAPVMKYVQANPQPGWLAGVTDDEQLLTRLQLEVESAPDGGARPEPVQEWEGLGIGSAWNAIGRGLTRLRTAIVGAVGKEASDRIRPAVIPGITNFLGDVLIYLHQQGDLHGKIRERVAEAIHTAASAAGPDDHLVVVAHSMGGNIVYDLLTEELADIPVPLLITAGTQVGFFEELKLFRASDNTIPPANSRQKVARPGNVHRWINAFDYSDLLGFMVGTIIDGVEDFFYRTGSLFAAHSQYFLQPSFHERLAARAEEKP